MTNAPDLSHIANLDEIDPDNRALIAITHLIMRGHISPLTAIGEYGSKMARLGDAIHRLRGPDADLVPPGFEIVTVWKRDTGGRQYGEYHLVRLQPAQVAA